MNIKTAHSKLVFKILIVIFAFYINYYYANKGLYPIDTFSFFDTGYYITEGQHPIKDFWVISGILIDYLQAFFFSIFGHNWNAYVFHACFFNILISLSFFIFLNNFNSHILQNFILSICVATLCYPIIGTPFPYQHSLILSVITIFIFYLAVIKKNNKFWFILPLFMCFSFLSMQLPSGLINFLIIIFLLIYFFIFNKQFIKYFIAGSVLSLALFFSYLTIFEISFREFYTQIILFPIEVGLGRIVSNESAFDAAKLSNKMTVRGTLGHFKFLFLFIFLNLAILIFYLKKNYSVKSINQNFIINLFIFFCSLGFIFHQLITANQTFIFCLIPILCGFSIIQLDQLTKVKNKMKIQILLIFIVLFSTIKYHLVYNENRKFVDLQNINLVNAINSDFLNIKLKNLQWITPNYYNKNPELELSLLKESMKVIKNDQRNKMIITHYQFFSLISEENLNIPNRWYYPNNTFPSSKKSKLYDSYIKKFQDKVADKNIEIIYVAETIPGEFKFMNFKKILNSECLKRNNHNKILYSIRLNSCY